MTRVDGSRLRADLEDLARIGAHPGMGITRTAFTTEDARARQWYSDKVVEAGLALDLDGIGNMFAHDPASRSGRSHIPAVWSGSHLDTVPRGGAYDGAVGAVAALECLRRITELGLTRKRAMRAVVFADEEGNYSSLLGSTAMKQGFTDKQLSEMVGREGDRLTDALAAWPWAAGSTADTRIEPGTMHAFVELHIEQGPKLEAAGIDIGVVTSIVGLGGARARFMGRTDHAGTTPMAARADALVAASEFIAAVPSVATSAGPESVATCGFVHVTPGAANVVPGEVEVSLDFRDGSIERVRQIADGLEALARAVAARHGVAQIWMPHEIIPPAPLDAGVQDSIEAAARGLGLSSMRLPSGAGHDSQNMAQLAPTGMIFIPSVGGRSHSPAEFTEWDDVIAGADVLLATILALMDA